MSPSTLYPCNRVSRRRFCFEAGGGFLGLALGALLAEGRSPRPGAPAAKAKSVIFLFMCGGVSHLDTFDPKDNKWAGKMLDVIGSNNGKPQSRPVLHCPRTFTRYGKSGIPVCEW